MPKINGLFDSFDNLDAISVESLIPWLKNPPSLVQLEDYLGNRILYSTTLPLTDFDMKVDLAILREALRINGPHFGQVEGPLLGNNPFLNITLRKIMIPQRFLQYVPDLVSLTWAFVDGLLLRYKTRDLFEDLWTVVLTDDIDEIVGSVLMPRFEGSEGTMNFSLMGKDYKIQAGSLIVVSCPTSKCQITYKFSNGKILGKNMSAVEVYGGKLGLIIDGRAQ